MVIKNHDNNTVLFDVYNRPIINPEVQSHDIWCQVISLRTQIGAYKMYSPIYVNSLFLSHLCFFHIPQPDLFRLHPALYAVVCMLYVDAGKCCTPHSQSVVSGVKAVSEFVLNSPRKRNPKLKQQEHLCNNLPVAPRGTRNMTTCTTLLNWAHFFMSMCIYRFHSHYKPLIYKFPMTLHRALPLFFPPPFSVSSDTQSYL